MQKRVWIFQYTRDIAKLGERAPHYVGWYDLDGHRHSESCGSGAQGKKNAERRKRQIQSELDMGLHNGQSRRTWDEFCAAYQSKVMPGLSDASQEQVKTALDTFKRIVKPGRLERVNAQSIDTFKAARRKERGKNPGSTISPATVNKDLRHIKAALRVAHDWGWLPRVPKIRMEKAPQKLVRFVTTEHFAAIYHTGCEAATWPENPSESYTTAEWWRALLCFAYMTGWRIREILSLRREDLVDGSAITRHGDNKGKRDELVPLHPVILEHLDSIASFHPLVFRLADGESKLWKEFRKIQKAAGIALTCRESHEHTDSCPYYGFHDFRRAFATLNADRLTADALQKLMRHKSYATTQGYINMARQLNKSVENLHVPDVLKTVAAG